MDGFGEHGVVERFVVGHDFPVAQHLRVQQLAPLNAMLAAEGALQFGEQFGHADGGEKTQAAEIDGEQRNLAAADGAGGGKQRAVAAQHDDQIAALGNVLAREAFEAVVEIGRGLFVGADGDAARAQPLHKLGHNRAGRRRIRFGEDSDCANGGHGAETPCSLPRLGSGYPSRSFETQTPSPRAPRVRRRPDAAPDREQCRPFPPGPFLPRTAV